MKCARHAAPCWLMSPRSRSINALQSFPFSAAVEPRGRKRRGHWEDVGNQREFLEQLGRDLNIKQPMDWLSVTRTQIERKGGYALFWHYESLDNALRTIFPEITWPSYFGKTGADKWKDKTFLSEFISSLGGRLGIEKLSDWYKVSRKDVKANGGRELLKVFGSLIEPLSIAYPEHAWEGEKFTSQPSTRKASGYWQDQSNLFKILVDAEKKLGIEKMEDWYSVALTDLRQLGLPPIRRVKLAELLQQKYPNFHWDKVYLLKGKYAQQKRLERMVTSLFPDKEVGVNVRKEAGLLDPETNQYLELDIFIPSLNLAFEYQERQHYTGIGHGYEPVESYKGRDKKKKNLAKEKNITLILVPCWWDGRKESLAATIRSVRPDLLLEDIPLSPNEAPISEEIPEGFFDEKVSVVEDVGVPTSACFFTKSTVHPKDWWLFEKYDGVRGFWNPLKKAFFSRSGRELSMPKEVVDEMPNNIFLDGELWFGRENFLEASKIATSVDRSQIDWSKFKYMVFDVPNHKGTYSERYKALEEFVGNRDCKYISLAQKEVCRDIEHMDTFFQDIVEKGGEGIILRNPNAPYQMGRCPGYLKHKRFRDAEAKVVEALGTYQWLCELPNGVQFEATAATTEFLKRVQLQPGDIVSFKHHGYLMGTKKPKFPTLYRKRTDISWQQVVDNWKEQKLLPRDTSSVKKIKKSKLANGYWRKIEHRKQFFFGLANELNFNPYVPNNWNKVTTTIIKRKKGGLSLLETFNCKIRKAIEATFPDMQFKWKRANFKPQFYWLDPNNVRKFFDEFAAQEGFDPSDATKWKSIKLSSLRKKRGWRSVKLYFNSLEGALHAAYPEHAAKKEQ